MLYALCLFISTAHCCVAVKFQSEHLYRKKIPVACSWRIRQTTAEKNRETEREREREREREIDRGRMIERV